MSIYDWRWPGAKPRPPRRPPHWRPASWGRVTLAPHIRGRVFKRGNTWHMEVVNTRTGEVIQRDSTSAWGPVDVEADRVVAAARMAWFYGFRHKALK